MNKFLLSAALAAIMLGGAPAKADELSAAQKTEIESLVRDYIMKNPDVLIESLETYQRDAQAKMEEGAREAAKKLVGGLKDSGLPSVGAKDPDVTIVEFMDYNCGYCKKAFDEVRTILKDDKKVKFYFVEMPILGPTSLEASKWALAADKQGKYFEYHSALMTHQGQKSESVLESKAKEVGLDVKKLKEDKDSEEIATLLSENMTHAETLGVTGTPGFIIGEEVVRGYITLDQMKEMIADAREG